GGGTVMSGATLALMLFTGPYRIPMLEAGISSIATNTCGMAPFRGPWAIETIAREQMVDSIARELGIDPLEGRRGNGVRQADLTYAIPAGLVFDVVTPEETMEQAAQMVDWEGFRERQAAARAEGRALGVGLSVCIEPSAVGMGALATEQ